jgi:hypothetical protein
LIYNHLHLEVDVVGVLPVGQVELKKRVACCAVSSAESIKNSQLSRPTERQSIRRCILEELIDVIGDFPQRVGHSDFNFDDLGCCNVVQSRHF